MLKRFGAVLSLSIIAACGGGGKDGTTTPLVTPVLTSVNVTLGSVSIAQGASTTATATGVDQTGTPMNIGPVVWLTSAPSVATVSTSGQVTGVGVGQTTITASASGKTGQALVTVTLPPPALASLQVVLSPATLAPLGSGTATALGRDQYGASIATGTVNWSSSNTSVATVSPAGITSAVAPGTTTITATAGGFTAQSVLSVGSSWTPTSSATLIATSLNSNSRLTNRFGTSDFASLDIICGLSSKLFVMAIGFDHIVSRNGLIAYNGTNIASTTATWLEGTTFHSLIHPGPNSATKTLANLIATGTDFVVAFGEFNGSTQATTFKVAGMTAAMQPVLAACPGANLATPAQAGAMIGELRQLRALAR